jgi:hypothetical protein
MDQWTDGLSLYEYVQSAPVVSADGLGRVVSDEGKLVFNVSVRRWWAQIGYATQGTFAVNVLGPSGGVAGRWGSVSGDTMEPRKGKYNIGHGKKKYPIPAGKWKGKADRFPRAAPVFAIRMIDRPETGFTGLLFHAGAKETAYAINTEGCILGGRGYTHWVSIRRRDVGKSKKKWRRYVRAGMIDELTKDEVGIRDAIHQTRTTMREIEDLYERVLKDCGEECLRIEVVVGQRWPVIRRPGDPP